MTYLPGLELLLETAGDLLDFIEVEPETFWVASTDGKISRQAGAHAWLKQQGRPIALHGVSAAIGGCAPLTLRHARELKRDVQLLSPKWLSEHLAFQSYADGPDWQPAGFFLPPLQTEASIHQAVAQMAQRRELGLPIAFETGVNYLRPQPGEIPDGEFWAALAETADTGILLDLHNLWTNERNGRCRVKDVLAALPLDRVVELHVAGGESRGGYWLDAHTHLAPPPVLELARELVPQLPSLRGVNLELLGEGVIANGIPVQSILTQLDDLQAIWSTRASCNRVAADASAKPSVPVSRSTNLPEPRAWETLLGRAVHRRSLDPSPTAARLEADPGLPLLQELIDAARRGQLVAALPLSFRELFARGEQIAEQRVSAYLLHTRPLATAMDEARAFHQFARSRDWTLTHELASFELLELEVQQTGKSRTLETTFDLAPLVNKLRAGVRPEGRPPRLNVQLLLEAEITEQSDSSIRENGPPLAKEPAHREA